MKGFGDFKRIAVVCLSNEDELKCRLAEKKKKDEHVYAMKESTLKNTQGIIIRISARNDVIFTLKCKDRLCYEQLCNDMPWNDVRQVMSIIAMAMEVAIAVAGIFTAGIVICRAVTEMN
uniref:Uncharacterized protein n=1 Tax=Glossina austeni TaxID=7395 RepID=A0A1A9UDR4_GLOAU